MPRRAADSPTVGPTSISSRPSTSTQVCPRTTPCSRAPTQDGQPHQGLGQPSAAPLPSTSIRTRDSLPGMSWTWRYEAPDGSTVEPGPEAPAQPDFPTQSDAE